VAWTFGVSTEHVFRAFGLLVVVAVVLVFRRTLLSLALSVEMRMVLLSLLILNAYMFRYYIAIPWMVSDLGSELGLAMVLLGLLRERRALTYAGLLVATLGKQTAIALIPGVIAWIWLVWNAPGRVKVARVSQRRSSAPSSSWPPPGWWPRFHDRATWWLTSSDCSSGWRHSSRRRRSPASLPEA